MAESEEESSNRRTPPPSRIKSGTPPPQAGEETLIQSLQELSDGLKRSMTLEGADVAPESPDGLEYHEKKNGGGGGTRTLDLRIMSPAL